MEYIRESNMNITAGFTLEMLEKAISTKEVFCAKALIYENPKGLYFNLNGIRGIMPKDRVIYYNQIDIGIFLCFVELCLEHNNIDYKRELFVEDDHDKEYNLTASYHI